MNVVAAAREGNAGMRAGAHALSILAIPLNYQIIAALEQSPLPLIDLRRACGSPPQTTLRMHLSALDESGIVERHRQTEFPGSVEIALGRPGRDLAAVAQILSTWLSLAPDGPLQLGSTAARSVVKALVGGWSANIIRALAAKRLTLTDLSRLIATLSYPSLERRLAAMRQAGLIAPHRSAGRGTPYGPTQWLRIATGPLCAAMSWEQAHASVSTPPVGRLDVESTFLLIVPELVLSRDLSGTCRLAVELVRRGSQQYAGVTLDVAEGTIGSCTARLGGSISAAATGPVGAWLSAMAGASAYELEFHGDVGLAREVVESIPLALNRYALDSQQNIVEDPQRFVLPE